MKNTTCTGTLYDIIRSASSNILTKIIIEKLQQISGLHKYLFVGMKEEN